MAEVTSLNDKSAANLDFFEHFFVLPVVNFDLARPGTNDFTNLGKTIHG